MSFLNAEWRKLAFANYEVNPSVLEKYVPSGTELDFWDGKCFVSLVGFMFMNTKLLGIRIPFHSNFEEVNLRFYVKRLEDGVWKRGVVFISEIVPKPALTWVARIVYKEHYETLPMRHKWELNEVNRTIEYRWKKNKKWHQFKVVADLETSEIDPNGEIEFITQHYWGYAKVNENKTNEYEVTHPRWLQYEITSYEIDVDFGSMYGTDFEFLNTIKPSTVMLAEGSVITVESKTSISI